MTEPETFEAEVDLQVAADDDVEVAVDRVDDIDVSEADPELDVDAPEISPELDQRRGPIAHYDERHCVLWMGSMPIPFRRGVNANEELIELLGAAIRGLRGLEPTDPCPLRKSEHQLLADLLDLDAPDLRTDLRRHLGLTKRQAGDTLMQLRRVRAKDEILLG